MKFEENVTEDEVRRYLAPDPTVLMKEQAAVFDGKKTVWIPYPGVEGYAQCEVQGADGDNVTVFVTHSKEEKVVKKTQCEQMNPPKYEKCSDMANLTYLNEASVLYNLRARYTATLIYTYSGLFCIAVNPYARLPIYNDTCIKMFRGKRRIEMPPHIFAIVDNAYQNMLQEHDNQSMLITGESGAGKTENTKKVIMYIAKVAGQSSINKEKDTAPADGQKSKITGSLDEQIVEANPLMEAFGNAKTIRNNNSSRFGKFIRAHFSQTGKLAGADIESYLLEKNRVTFQLSAERNYHIFYQLLYCTSDEELATLCLPSRESCNYGYLKLGQPTVDGIDDMEEFGLTENAIIVLGFTPEERNSMFALTAGILNFSNIQLKERPRDEQAEIIDPADGERCAHLFGIGVTEFHKSLLKPRVKVGTEFVNKQQSMAQVHHAISALAKKLYEGMFLWQVMRINQALDTKQKRAFFIGVLDIAGFEIFEYNSFDQLCINLTNEKLQQFFNHTMFVLEQEEYKKEGLVWDTIDFAMDLELTIQLIENPGGIFPILEEECIVPKANDDTYLAKLHKSHAGKHQSYGKPKASLKGKGGDFILHHYAGSVGYSVANWLEKNKDPINTDTAGWFSKSSNSLMALLFKDYNPDVKQQRKGSAFMTVSLRHREALKALLTTLGNTTPHFVRCIIPNELKKPGMIDGDLTLHQLRCNGVLEGIRICRKGFPSRMPFNDFKQRYQILASAAVPQGFVDGKVACEKLIDSLQLDESEFRIGHTKVFFKSGIVGELEDLRDERLSTIISQFQAYCKANLQRIEYKKMHDRRVGLAVIQRNVRKNFSLKDWHWWKLFLEVKPMLALAKGDAEMEEKENALKAAQEKAAADSAKAADLEQQMTSTLAMKEKLVADLESTSSSLYAVEEKLVECTIDRDNFESKMIEAQEKLEEEEAVVRKLNDEKKKNKGSIEDLSGKMSEAQTAIAKLESEKSSRDKAIDSLNAEFKDHEETIGKLTSDKGKVEETLATTQESLQNTDEKAKRLGREKTKLESSLEDTKSQLTKQKEASSKLDREKKKLETTLRDTDVKLEETKGELTETKDMIVKKDKSIREANERIEATENQVKIIQKKTADLLARIEELEDELENEKKAKKKMETIKLEVESEMEAMNERLEEAGGATQAQIDVAKKKDAEIAKLRKEIEETNSASDQALTSQKNKFNQMISEGLEEVESVKKLKAKSDKEKAQAQAEVEDITGQLESQKKKSAAFQKQARAMEDKLKDTGDTIRHLEEAVQEAAAKPSGTVDAATLAAATEEVEHKLSIALRNVKNLSSAVAEAKDFGNGESRAKFDAQQKLKQAMDEMETLAEALEEEQASKTAMQVKLSKAVTEAQGWKTKYDMEGSSRVEELEDSKRKLATRVQEMEESLAAAETKAAGMEKVKNRMNEEVEDLLLDLERAQSQAFALEKKQKKVDSQINEWRTKCEETQAELDRNQKECRNFSTELLKLRAAHEDATDKLDGLRKENRALSAELSSVTDQLSEGGKSTHETEKMRRALEQERDEMQVLLEESDAMMDIEQGKNLKVQLELTQLKQTHERRQHEKDDESESMRQNHMRQIESLQHMLDTQNRSTGEASKIRKKLEDQVLEVEASKTVMEKFNNEQSKQIKKLAAQVKELTGLVDDESRGRDESKEASARAERRANDLAVQLDEARLLVEQADRARKIAVMEKTEISDRISELQSMYNSVSTAKRKAEEDYHELHEEVEEMENLKIAAEERANKVNADFARAVTELAATQENVGVAEASRNNLLKQVQELQARAEDAEINGGKGLKNTVRKMETRIVELESELEGEQRAGAENLKNFRRTEKKAKDLQFALDDNKASVEKSNEAAEKLGLKFKRMRLQLEEAESKASNLDSKLKKTSAEHDDAEERCDAAETALAKSRQRTAGSTRATSGAVSRTRSRMRTPDEDE